MFVSEDVSHFLITYYRVSSSRSVRTEEIATQSLLPIVSMSTEFSSLNSQFFLLGCGWSMMSQDAMEKLLTAQND